MEELLKADLYENIHHFWVREVPNLKRVMFLSFCTSNLNGCATLQSVHYTVLDMIPGWHLPINANSRYFQPEKCHPVKCKTCGNDPNNSVDKLGTHQTRRIYVQRRP